MRTRLFAAVVAFVGASSVPAVATEHLLVGTMLSSRNRGGNVKFVWVSKDPAVTLPAAAPSAVGATLVVSASDGDTATIALGGGAWSEATGTAVYSNRAAPGGDSVCKAAIIRDTKRVKVTCVADPIDTLDPGPEGAVAVRLTVGSDDYCASFGGTIKEADGIFRARRAPAPPACDVFPTTTTTSTTVIGNCTTTTLIPYCGNPLFGLVCAAEQCPSPQTCGDDGAGHCGCTGPAVPCGDVPHSQLCQFGTCPPGMQCRSLYVPPACANACGCQ